MLKLASDVNFNGKIVSGLLRAEPAVDLLRTQDVLGETALDTEILAWAAVKQRIVITKDTSTMIDFAYHRVAAGQLMTGLIVVTKTQRIGDAISDILTIIGAGTLEDFQHEAVLYLPY